jgi:hypothetical protein
MIQANLPSIFLLITLVALILKWGTSSILIKGLKAKIRILEDVQSASSEELKTEQIKSEKFAAELIQLKANNTALSQKNDQLSIKYEGILQIEEIIELKRSEFKTSMDSLNELNERYKKSLEIYQSLERETILYQNDLEISQFGLYKPQYNYYTSEEYKQKLEYNYLKQRECIKVGSACISNKEWALDGSKSEGKKLTTLYKKLMLFAFNGECDALIAKLKWNTATRSIERLNNSFESINKLGLVADVQLTRTFLDLKLGELALTHEYENKKQDEREEQRRIRERMREEEKVLREIEQARKDAEEEEKRYQKALSRVKEELRYASKEEVEALNEKVSELEIKLKDAEERKERALSMAQQTKVGHIYIISNIGSFGEDIYKIGMTRRLEPLDRVRELSDAAVPFRYDVHAVIFSENAPQLEYDIHKHFNTRRINRVNGRKEFFKVSLNEIATYVKEHTNADIEFTLLAEAKEYRETLSIIESILKLEDVELKEPKFPESLV